MSGRFRPQGSQSHHIERLGRDDYRISWVIDRFCTGSRLRFPTRYRRDTDLAGAQRFAKRWGIAMPVVKGNTS